MAENVIHLDINARETCAGIQEVSGALGGLTKTVHRLGAAVQRALVFSAVTGYMSAAIEAGGRLDKELLVLRLSLGKLKAEIGRAAAPLAGVFIPIVQDAVWAATRLTKAVGKVLTALFGGSAASKALNEETQEAAESQIALASSVNKVKRTLAGFDQINRLGSSESGSGGGGSALESSMPAGADTLSPQLQAVVDKILSLLEPLKKIDLSSAAAAFDRLRQAITPISRALFSGLEWAWHNLLVPLAAWTIEDLLPAFLRLLSQALTTLNDVLVALRPLAEWLWNNFLKPLAQWTGEKIIDSLHWLTEKLKGLSAWIGEHQDSVQKFVLVVGALAAAWALVNGAASKWNSLIPTATTLAGGLGSGLNDLELPIGLVTTGLSGLVAGIVLLIANWDKVKTTASQVWLSVKATWGNAWSWFQGNVISPLVQGVKNGVNGVIGFINGLISGAVKGLNSLIRAINTLSFTIPSWVPDLGGKKLGFNLKTVTAPQIPYLARGAVLPANKPFMAVVGDQRHGTNVEAPLTTIQEAVALVMGEQTSALMRGFEASVGVQKEILQAVLGITIGDELIGQAVSRYQSKLAVVRGG